MYSGGGVAWSPANWVMRACLAGGVSLGQGGGPPLLCPAYLPHPVGVTGAGLPGHTSAIHTRSVRGLSTEGLESRVS